MLALKAKTLSWLKRKQLEHVSSEAQDDFHFTWHVMDLSFKKLLTVKDIPTEINNLGSDFQLNILFPLIRDELKELNFNVTDFDLDSVYYSRQASWAYWSCSMFKSFMKCEAQAMAWLDGEDVLWKSESKALIEGKLLHMSVLEPHMLRKENMSYLKRIMPEAFKKKGPTSLLKNYSDSIEQVGDWIADMPLIQKWKRDPEVTFEKAYIFELAGVLWKSKLDIVGPDFIADLKFMRTGTFDKSNWFTEYGYDFQAFLYSQGFIQENLSTPKYGLIGIEKREFGVVESKWIHDLVDHTFFNKMVNEKMPRFEAVKKKEIEPSSCGECDFCRMKYKLIGIN